MSKYTSISTNGNHYLIKPLDDSGENYQTWLMRMELILQGRDAWDVIDPSTEGVPKPTTILYPVLGHYPCKDCAHHKSHLFSHKSPASQSITSQLCMIAFFNQKNRILEESQAISWEA